MNTHDKIELPPNPITPMLAALIDKASGAGTAETIWQILQEFANRAIEADRQRRGGQVRQYYYKVSGCQAEQSTHANCICWHDKGTGVFKDMAEDDRPHGVKFTWRDKPQPAEPVKCLDPSMSEHACSNRAQCWEPCGELGKSIDHAKVAEPVKSTRPDGGIDADGFFAQLEAEKPAEPVTARVAAATVSRKGYSMGTLLWTDAGRMADLPDGWKLVPIERSYDMRAKAIIAYNTAVEAGQDRDDALGAAFLAELEAAPTPPAGANEGYSREWCMKMAQLEADAGYPDQTILNPPAAGQAQGWDTQVINDILAERELQVQTGYDSDHDDEHVLGEIAAMAAYYMLPPAVRDWPATETGYGDTFGEALLPEGWQASPHHSRRVELVRAVAMGLAEIERLDRAAMKETKP